MIDLRALQATFENSVLAALKHKELIDDGIIQQILAQEHTEFSVLVGDPFSDSESKQFIARYIERGPISLQKLSIQHDIVTYTTNDGTAHEFDALEFLALLTSHLSLPYESIARYFGAWFCRTRGEIAKKLQHNKIYESTATIPESIKAPSLK